MPKNELMMIKKTSEFIAFVQKIGYKESAKNGSSHRIFKKPGLPVLSIPNHDRELSPGVKRNLIKLITGSGYYQN